MRHQAPAAYARKILYRDLVSHLRSNRRIVVARNASFASLVPWCRHPRRRHPRPRH